MKTFTKQIVRTAAEADPDVTAAQVRDALALLEGKAADQAMPPLLLSVAQTCAALSISRQSLWRLAHDNVLRPVKVRGSSRYRRADIDAFVRRGDGEEG